MTMLSGAAGILAGIASAVFLHTLAWATQTREALPLIIWLLPLIGLLIGWVYHDYGKDAAPGNNLIIDEIHDPKKTVPPRMAPLILGGTILTHLFGGSAGREGTAVQMGAALAEWVGKRFSVTPEERRALLMAGAGAGFGAAIGAPIAGAIFGLEMIYVRRFRLFAAYECVVASFTGYATAWILHAPHTPWLRFDIPPLDTNNAIFVLLAAMAFGLAARGFVLLTHAVERVQARLIRFPPFRPLAGGLLLVVLYRIENSYRYTGLGIPVIQQALHLPASFRDPLLKALFTALTIGSGFKGGEFIPLVFIGATLGSALSYLIPISFQLMSAVGFAATFGAAANTPIACAVMACELFGWGIAPYAFSGCIMAYAVSGRSGIYKTQR